MKKKPYRVLLIPAVVCAVITAFLVFYTTGVVDRAAARDLISERLDIVCKNIDLSLESEKDLYDSCCAKARVVSIMLSDNPAILSGESTLEEIRVAIGADIISISDNNGAVIYSTDTSTSSSVVFEEFMPAVGNRVFSKAVITESEGRKVIVTGSSRLDEPGVIQIEFPFRDDQAAASTIVPSMPIMNHGHLAVIDTETNTYVSHTDSVMNGSAVQFPQEKFSSEDGWFSSEYDGKSVLVKYRRHGDLIMAGILPYSEVYQRRNAAVRWVLFSMTAVTLVIILSLRNYIIRRTPLHK